MAEGGKKLLSAPPIGATQVVGGIHSLQICARGKSAGAKTPAFFTSRYHAQTHPGQ